MRFWFQCLVVGSPLEIGREIHFALDCDDRQVQIILKDAPPEYAESNQPGVFCTVETFRDVSAEFEQALLGWAAEVERFEALPVEYQDLDLMGSGILFTVPKQRPAVPIPFACRQIIDEIRHEMRSSIDATIRTIQWRCGLGRNFQIIEERLRASRSSLEVVPSLTVSNLGSRVDWWEVSDEPRLVLPHELGDEVATVVATRVGEPLAHELLREAWSLRHEHPRSAVMMAVASIEVGVKHCQSKLEPGIERHLDEAHVGNNDEGKPNNQFTFWDEINSLRSLLVQVNKATRLETALPPRIMQSIGGWHKLRNRIAHSFKQKSKDSKLLVEAGALEAFLLSVQDLLWILDFYAGREWALEYVSKERVGKWKPASMS